MVEVTNIYTVHAYYNIPMATWTIQTTGSVNFVFVLLPSFDIKSNFQLVLSSSQQ